MRNELTSINGVRAWAIEIIFDAAICDENTAKDGEQTKEGGPSRATHLQRMEFALDLTNDFPTLVFVRDREGDLLVTPDLSVLSAKDSRNHWSDCQTSVARES